MNWDQIEGSWKELKGKVRQRWGKLTDDEVDQICGKRDELIGRLQKSYGYRREAAEREVENWSRDVRI